jgi:hypothetical protein
VLFRAGDRKSSVTVSGELEASLSRLMSQIEGTTFAVMVETTERIAEEAKRAAPVKYGHLKRGIATYTRIDPANNEIAVGITQTDEEVAEYQWLIRYSSKAHKIPPGGEAGRNFHASKIRVPMQMARRQLIRDIDAKLKAART